MRPYTQEVCGAGTEPARAITLVRMVVKRAIDLNPVLLSSPKYAPLRADVMKLCEATDIQGEMWGKLSTNRQTTPCLPYPTLTLTSRSVGFPNRLL